jgi:cytochrome c biogenesis protein ResB
MSTRKIGTWIFIAVLGASLTLPSFADKVPSQKAQLRAAQKMQKRQNKANRKYAKAQRKAERRMIKKDRKNTHLPGQRK